MAISRDLLLIGGGRITTALLGLVSIRVATNLLSPEQYGALSLLVAIQLLCGMFLINPVEQHIYRHAHAWWDEGTLLARLFSYKIYTGAISFIGAVLVIVVTHPQSFQAAMLVSLIMLCMVVAVTWNGITVPMLNMLGYRAESIYWAVLSTFLSVLFSVLFVYWQHDAIAWFAGQAVGMACGALGAWISIQRKGARANHPTERLVLLSKETIISYCIPLALATGLMWLQLSGYRFAVEHFWGLSSLGYIAVGFVLTSQIWGLLEYLATQLLYPAFYRQITGASTVQNEAAFSDLLNILGPMSLVLVGVSILAAPALLYMLVSQQYQSAITFVYFGVVIECCRVLSNLFSRAAQITKHTKSLALPYAVGGGLQLLFIYVAGTLHADTIWVAVSLVIGAVSMLVIMAVQMYKEVVYRLELPRWLWAGGVLIICLLVCILLPTPNGALQALTILAVIALSGGGAVYWLAANNPSVERLLGVKLRED
ncbi:MAG: hypothetical protein PXX73_01575 [Sideroxydans sp.]|nr:hypothetical protein [Sideroxydans sp.]